MPARYIQLDRNKFTEFLTSKGFVPTTQYKEIVFVRRHSHNPNLMVKVYSSLTSSSCVGRSCGEDAIRVVAVYDDGQGKSFGIYKATRTYRTGSQEAVQERVLERMREAYAKLNEWLKRQR